MELVTVTDPVEKAYSMGMPKGWQNSTYSARVFDTHSAVHATMSPDGSVLMYTGDPSLPQYWNPATATPVTHNIAKVHPRMKIESFIPAKTYFPDYVNKKFGKLADFKLVSTEEDPEAEAKFREKVQAAGVQMSPTVAKVSFTYTDEGKPMNGLILGSTADAEAFWIVTVSGIVVQHGGNPKDYAPMLDAMARTYKTNPEWQAAQAAKHAERMAQIDAFGRQLTAQHNQNMAAIQMSAQRHQERMAAIHAQGDASMKSYYDRMASGDAQHRRFLNYINEENTVVSTSGKAFQVDGSYQRYFVNPQNGKYVGGDITMDKDKLRTLGLNPDDYQEMKIKP